MTLTTEQAQLRAKDKPWNDGVISDLKRTGRGWSIGTKDSGFFLSNDQLGDNDPPELGQKIATYTHRGAMIRGVDLRGEPLFYKTQAELDQEHEELVEKSQKEKKEKFEAEKEELDRQFSALPEAFQRRISWFRANKPGWRWEYESYEMTVCVDAVKIAEALKTVSKISAFSEMKWETQIKKVPGLYDEHSGNSFGMAVRLAGLYVRNPLLVIAEHGALVPLVGCNDYGCAHPRPSDVMDFIEEAVKEPLP